MTSNTREPAPREPRHEVLQGRTITVTMERAADPSPVKIEARLLDVSRSGMKLSIPSCLAIQEALVLTLDSPEVGLELSLPARVCWTRPAQGESWRIGCTFNPPLPEDTLSKLAIGGYIQRRKDPRRVIAADGSVRWMGGRNTPVEISNVSPGGFCIRSPQGVKSDRRLLLQLDNEEGDPVLIPAKAQWRQVTEEGCVVGCAFVDKEGYRTLLACLRLTDDVPADRANFPRGRFYLGLAALTAVISVGLAWYAFWR